MTLRVGLSIAGSLAASVAASWVLRRLLLAAEQGTGEERSAPAVVVVLPIIVGNTLSIGRPRRRRRRWQHAGGDVPPGA